MYAYVFLIATLSSSLASSSNDFVSLTKRIETLETSHSIHTAELKSKIVDLDAKIDRLQTKNADLESQLKTSRAAAARAANTTVAFTVAHGPAKSYSTRARIEFPTVITNIGNGWNALTNEFLCPVTGMYFFTVNAVAQSSNQCMLDLWLGETWLVTALAATTSNAGTTNSVLVQCDEGSKVYVTCNQISTCVPYGSTSTYRDTVTFGGFLIQAL